MEFLYQNGGTLLISFILLLIVISNVKKLCRVKSTCGCSCEDCASYGICHRNEK